uniref:DUF86 domain-containing protein n=1 Tax=Thermofilum pendens TaxID=2269 RepID=A0A7J3X7N6_THEPE
MGVLERLLKLLLHYTNLLDKLGPQDLEDEYKYLAALHLLQVQAQALMDIFARAASALGMEVEGYVDAGYKLRAVNIIDSEELAFYIKVVGFRNVVVHEYGEVNSRIVREIIEGRRYRDVARLGVKTFEELRKRGVDC